MATRNTQAAAADDKPPIEIDQDELQADNSAPVREDAQPVDARTALQDMHTQAQSFVDEGFAQAGDFPGTPPAVSEQKAAKQEAVISGTLPQSVDNWQPNLLAEGQQPPAMVMSSADYRQQQASRTNMEARARHKEFSETVPGGRYLIDGQWFNANGDLIDPNAGQE